MNPTYILFYMFPVKKGLLKDLNYIKIVFMVSIKTFTYSNKI